jgi:hypothetical protein
MYQNREGGNIFEPDVLKAIYAFESSIAQFPPIRDCGFGPRCMIKDSLISYFFQNGELVDDIEGVLRTFVNNKAALSQLDQYFGSDNLQSNVTKSFIRIGSNVGQTEFGVEFFESFYRDFLWKEQRKRTYSAMIHTWDNEILKSIEANDALHHDSLWSIGSLCFVALMILLKVRSVFVVFSSMLGMVLSFSVSYYWVSSHFTIQNITLLWVAGLFVMLGIGADDIFLMVDSFDHTENEFQENNTHQQNRIVVKAADAGSDDENDDSKMKKHGILRLRMESAYRRAGSMMLVSSVTTATCFFSNAFGVLTVVQEFGIFMGMVVLINYIHVMTILPSSILVNEIYIVPLFHKWFKSKQHHNEQTNNNDLTNNRIESDEENNTERGMPNSSANTTERTLKMNTIDRFLVEKYAPFINKRSYYLLIFSVILVSNVMILEVRKICLFISPLVYQFDLLIILSTVYVYLLYRQLSLVLSAH